jgi:hypothetical protein
MNATYHLPQPATFGKVAAKQHRRMLILQKFLHRVSNFCETGPRSTSAIYAAFVFGAVVPTRTPVPADTRRRLDHLSRADRHGWG